MLAGCPTVMFSNGEVAGLHHWLGRAAVQVPDKTPNSSLSSDACRQPDQLADRQQNSHRHPKLVLPVAAQRHSELLDVF